MQTDVPRPAASFGVQLLRARQERGIAPDDVARETRVPKRYLLALENESIGSLPGGLYNRAYLRAYAVYLGLDGDSILRDYDRIVSAQADGTGPAAQFDQIAALNAVVQQRQSQAAGGKTVKFTGRAIVGSMAVLVLAAGVWAGTRHVKFPAGISVASFGTPGVPVIDTQPNSGRITESAAPGVPPAAEPLPTEPRAPEPESEPPRPAAPTPAIVQKSAQTARVEERQVSTSIYVNDSGVGTDVVDRELVGRSDTFAVGSRVVFWTHVIGGRAGGTIRHVWFREGRPVATVKLPVRGASWRTQSQRTLAPGADGEWLVKALDEDGRVLAEHAFRCGP